ncbi:MAG: cytochrome P460 family protein [Deltaproteobacteria bacterium]|nr:cytochrome P460 family protein [Deltaproteobacteria bacterium]
MKKLLIALSCVVFVLGIAIGSTVFAEMPGPDPDALWSMQPGRAPHGPLHKVYVNDRALNSSRPPLQYGAIEVKENYSPAKELKAITVMYKINGYNPKDGDWFWVKYTPDGKAEKFGKPKGCIGCHGTRAKNDFVTIHEFK